MPVFWSGTDWDTIHKLSQGGWFVSTVFNKKREVRSCLAMTKPVGLCIDEIPTTVIQYLDPEIIKSWDQDYETNVTNVVHKYQGQYGRWNDWGDWRDKKEEEKQLALLPGSEWSYPTSDDGPTPNGPVTEAKLPRELTEEEIGTFAERREWRKGARRGSPPVDKNGLSGGW